MPAVRYSPPLVNNNPDFVKEPKRKAKPENPVGHRELVNSTLQEFPSPNSPLFNRGLDAIRKALGYKAFVVMSELGSHQPWFQLTQAFVADRTGLSKTASNKAIQQLVLAGYIERVECRKAGRRHGHVLHSRLEGNIEKLDGFVTHYSVDANTKEAATRHARKKVVRAAHNPSNPDRQKTGRKRKRRAIGNESVSAIDTIPASELQAGAEMGGAVAAPLGTPHNDEPTEEGENEILPTSFSGQKEERNPFFIPEGSSLESATVEGEASEVDPSPGAFGDPEADAQEDAPHPLDPVAQPELRTSWTNAIVRALTAPEYDPGVHVGYDMFSPFAPGAFDTPLDEGCLFELSFGFESIPRWEFNGDGAKLWLSAHKFGIVIVQCFRDFSDVTNLEAFEIVKLLRKGRMTRHYVLRTWAEIHYGYRRPFGNGNDFLLAWAGRDLNRGESGRLLYDSFNLRDALQAASGDAEWEKEDAECAAEDMWSRLLEAGAPAYKAVNEMQCYGNTVSLHQKIESYATYQHIRLREFDVFMGLWAYSVSVRDHEMRLALSTDRSVAGFRSWLLLTTKGRRLVHGVQHLNEKGEINFNLAVAAGWHSYEEFSVLASFQCAVVIEALRMQVYL